MQATSFPPAYCVAHGLFAARMIAFSGGTIGTIRNSYVDCPKCGRPSEIIPGTYDSRQEGLTVHVDPSISVQALRALHAIATRLEKAEISLEQAQAEAVKVSPKAASIFDVRSWPDEIKAAIIGPVIGAALMSVIQTASVAPPAVNVRVVVERELRARPLPTFPPIPTRRPNRSVER